MVECRTPEREVRGSRPTAAVLCPWARHFTPRKYWLITQEAMAPSRYDWKIVDWDVKPQHNQPTNFLSISVSTAYFNLLHCVKTRSQEITCNPITTWLWCHRRALIPLKPSYDFIAGLQHHYSPLWLKCRLKTMSFYITYGWYLRTLFTSSELSNIWILIFNFQMITFADFPYFYICNCQHTKE